MSNQNVSKNTELLNRIAFTIFALLIYRLGVHIPTPGVDSAAVVSFFSTQSSGIFGLLNTFTGGAFSQFSIFALGIMPYISASIIFQLLSSAIPYFENLRKEGESGRKKINQYTKYASVVLAVIQGLGISTFLLNSVSPEQKPLVTSLTVGFLPFQVMTVITLTAGTSFVMWLADQITERGIGNGSSLIIFTGIAAGIPNGINQLISLLKTNQMTIPAVLLLLLFMFAVIAFVIFVEVGQRKIPVQYSQRTAAGAPASQNTHLPIKVNFSGVIPPIFASSLLMFPATIAQFTHSATLKSFQEALSPSGSIYNILFVSLIVFFSFFYSEIVFNTEEMAENLKKYGGYIPGIRAGKSTSDYIKYVVDRVNVAGAIYLSFVCIMPGILISQLKIPFYFGGTSLLILVGVALDTAQQIQSYLINQKYQGLLNKVKVKSRRVQY